MNNGPTFKTCWGSPFGFFFRYCETLCQFFWPRRVLPLQLFYCFKVGSKIFCKSERALPLIFRHFEILWNQHFLNFRHETLKPLPPFKILCLERGADLGRSRLFVISARPALICKHGKNNLFAVRVLPVYENIGRISTTSNSFDKVNFH